MIEQEVVETPVEEIPDEVPDDILRETEAKQALLSKHGVPAYQCYADSNWCHWVCFYGDERAVDMAADVAIENGFRVREVRRVWFYYGNKRTVNPHWEIRLTS